MAASKSASVKLAGSLPSSQQDEPDGVAHLEEEGDLALEGRVGEELGDRLDLLAAGRVEVVRDAGEAALPREGELAARVELDVLEGLLEVGGVRDVRGVQRLDVALADQARDHPVGAAPHVAAGVLARLEQRAHLGVELVVVVVVLGVVDLDAGRLGERVERRARLLVVGEVDVLRPVRPVDDLLGVAHVLSGLRGGRRGPGDRGASGALAAAGRQGDCRAEPEGAGHGGPPAGEPADQGRARGGGGQVRGGALGHGVSPRGGGAGSGAGVGLWWGWGESVGSGWVRSGIWLGDRTGIRPWGQAAVFRVSAVFRVRTRCLPSRA